MQRSRGVLWIAAGAALWGTDSVLRRMLLEQLPPVQLVFYEHLILSAIALPIVWRRRVAVSKIGMSTWAAILGIAWVGSALSTVLFTDAVRSGSPTTAVLIQQIQPLLAMAFARLILGERWSPKFMSFAAVAVVAAYFMVFGASASPWTSVAFLPAVLAGGAASGWAFSTVWGRIAAPRTSFEVVTALRIVCALPALTIFVGVEGPLVWPAVRNIPALIWIALIPGFTALMLYYHGLRTATASQSTIAELAFPATASLLNWLFLGVAANLTQIAGFAVVWWSIFSLQQSAPSVSRSIS